MKNYKIINDKNELKKFIDWLPSTSNDDKFYISLFARKKYGATEGLKADKGQLKRFVSSKKDIFSKIKKLEVEFGSYMVGDLSVNDDSLVVYITPNPRNMGKASIKLAMDILKHIYNDKIPDNPISLGYNAVQTHGNGIFTDVDVDFTTIGKTKDRMELLDSILLLTDTFINRDALSVIDTNGGFHFLIRKSMVSKEFSKKWYVGFRKMKTEDFETTMNGDNMIPTPGCNQGGYTPKLLDI